MLEVPLDTLTIGYFELNTPLHPGDSIEIYTKWEVKIPGCFSRFCHIDQNYYVTQWFPKIPVYDKKGWHSYPYLTMGEFYYEFGDYNVDISLPENYVVGATGTLHYPEKEQIFWDSLNTLGQEVLEMGDKKYEKWMEKRATPKSSDEYKTLNFKARNVVDFAWVASKDFLVQHENFAYPNFQDSVSIWNYFYPKNRQSWKDVIGISKAALKSYGELCGPYPYPQVTSVDGDLSAGGGMEYPMLTIVNSVPNQYFMWQVVGHEIGHNWFYGLLGFNERRYAWMDEGLNTYAENRFMDDYLPDSASFVNSLPLAPFLNLIIDNFSRTNLNHVVLNTAHYQNMLQPSNLHSEDYTSMLVYAASTYYKPGVGFNLLENYVGREQFDQAMNRFYDQWKYRHPQPQDLQNSFEKSLNMDLEWLFQDYLASDEFPDYKFEDYQIEKTGDSYSTSLKIVNKGQTEQPLAISLYQDKSPIADKWLPPDSGVKRLTLKTKMKPDEARINPEMNTLESNYLNNYSRSIPPLDFNFLYDIPQPNKYFIGYLPYMNFNYYDGLKLGGGLYHLSHAIPKNTYLTYGSYALKSKEWNGTFMYTTGIYGDKLTYQLSSGLSHDVLKNQIYGEVSVNIIDNRDKDNYLSLKLNYLDVQDTDFLEKNYWTPGQFYHVTLKNEYISEEEDIDVENTVGIKYIYDGSSATSYWRLFGEVNPKQKFTDFLKIENRFYFSSYLFQYENLPKQYRHYASGSVDPEFQQIYLYDRSGDTRLSPFNNYFIPGGINLKGYQGLTDEEGNPGGNVWALGYNFKLKTKAAFLFFDAGDVVTDGRYYNINYDIGIGLDLGLLKFYLPLYVSNPYDKYEELSNWKAMKNRFLVNLNLSILNSFFGRD